MANHDYIKILKSGKKEWNKWSKGLWYQAFAEDRGGEEWVIDVKKEVDLSNLDLTGYDLRGYDLRMVNFENTILKNANLEGAKLGIGLSRLITRDFSPTTFLIPDSAGRTNLKNADFSGANLNAADLLLADLRGVNFENTNLENASFGFNSLIGAKFKSTILRKANFEEVNLEGVNFERSDLEGAIFKQASLKDTVFKNCNLKNTIFNLNSYHTYFSSVDFVNVDLEESEIIVQMSNRMNKISKVNINFIDANLTKISFQGGLWEGCKFQNTNLSDANFKDIDFSNSIFKNASLERAKFENCNLSDIDLKDLNLKNSKFYNTNLSGTDFNNANLSNADFCSKVEDLEDDFLEPTILTNANFKNATLISSNFNNLNLSFVNFNLANLENSNLSFTNLKSTNFENANLSQVNFKQADFEECILFKANLRRAYLAFSNIEKAKLTHSDLSYTNLSKRDFSGVNLSNTNLSNTDLSESLLINTNLSNAIISGSRIYGVSIWDIKNENLQQTDLIITKANSSNVTVDNIEIAQLIYLLLNNNKIRDVISTVAQKGVLILGRFTPERKKILDSVKAELRRNNFLPIMFEFERITTRDYTETIKILAGMSKFVIVDITDQASCPLELQATVPDYKIPFLPIILKGEQPFSMLIDLISKYEWVSQLVEYSDEKDLIDNFQSKILKEASRIEDKINLSNNITLYRK